MIRYDDLTYSFMEHVRLSYLNKIGKFEIRMCCDKDGWDFVLSWKQGYNCYYLAKFISKMDLINSEHSYFHFLSSIVEDMINVRDTMIRNVTFWTNCKDVR